MPAARPPDTAGAGEACRRSAGPGHPGTIQGPDVEGFEVAEDPEGLVGPDEGFTQFPGTPDGASVGGRFDLEAERGWNGDPALSRWEAPPSGW